MAKSWRRLAAVLFVAVLAGLLALSQSPKTRRAAALDQALAEGLIGRVDKVQEERLRNTITLMIEALGLDVTIAIDEKFDSSKLKVYTTSAGAEAITGCGPGNAKYDPELDAIFIDESFFQVDGFRHIFEASSYGAVLGFREDPVFPEVFLRFVLMHELGHRALHRNIAASGAGTTSREIEADNFALDGLRKFYALDRTRGSGLVQPPLIELVGGSALVREDLSPEEQVYVDLAGALFIMSVWNLYLGTPYSPFYHDAEHPTFLDRTATALKALRGRDDIGAELRSNLAFLSASVERESAVGGRTFTEVLTSAPISDVGFSTSGLMVLTVGNQQLLRVSNYSLVQSTINRLVRSEVVADLPPSTELGANLGFWNLLDGQAIWVDWEGDAWSYAGERRSPHDFGLPKGVSTRSCFEMVLPPQPSAHAIATVCDRDGKILLLSLKDGRYVAQRELQEFATAANLPKGEQYEVEIASIDHAAVLLAISTRTKNELVARVTLSIASLEVLETVQFVGLAGVINPLGGSERAWPLITQQVGTERKDFILARAPGTNDPIFATWRIGTSGVPVTNAIREFLVNQVGRSVAPDLIADFEPYHVNTWWLTSTRSLSYFANDSIYTVDTFTGTIEIAFHPVFEGTSIRIGIGGRWAVFLRGGSRVFVFDS